MSPKIERVLRWVWAYDSATVRAYDSATVRAHGSATVEAYDFATVEAYGSATVRAYGSATVRAHDFATVRAYGSATVRAHDFATVRASNLVAVHRHTGAAYSNPQVYGGVVIEVPVVETMEQFIDFYGLEAKRGKIVVFKLVSDDLVSGRGTAYPLGGKVEAPDWSTEAVCGQGLHFSPRPFMARKYADGTRYLACEVAVKDCVALGDKIKARACKVLREVDADGEPLAADCNRDGGTLMSEQSGTVAEQASAYFNSLPIEQRKRLAPLLEDYRRMGIEEALRGMVEDYFGNVLVQGDKVRRRSDGQYGVVTGFSRGRVEVLWDDRVASRPDGHEIVITA